MERLQLKHLAPYLPYELKVLFEYRPSFKCDPNYFKTELLRPLNLSCVCDKTYSVISAKPILRPLSDLTKEIEVNGEKFVPLDVLADLFGHGCLDFDLTDVLNQPYKQMQKILEWHFDVFGLIEKRLAVDVNKL
jgi:hypothetical protein